MRIIVTTDTHYCMASHKVNERMLEDIKIQRPNLLIHCGDVSSTNYYEQKQFWSLARSILGNEPFIITVNGNHDWWSKYHDLDPTKLNIKRPNSVSDIPALLQQEVYEPLNIHHASKCFTYHENGKRIHVSGFDGWYSDSRVPFEITNDSKMIPHYYIESNYLSKRNTEGFRSAIDFINSQDKKDIKILVTHFGFTQECQHDWKGPGYFGNNPRYEDYLENVDYLLYGHSHQYVNTYAKNERTRIINAGSDYNNPRYEIIDL